MDDLNYSETQKRLIDATRCIVDLNLDAFLDRINHCESVGSLLNPTLYMKGQCRLEKIKALTIKMQAVKGAMIELEALILVDGEPSI